MGEREKFEAWILAEYVAFNDTFKIREDGEYQNPMIRNAFRAWQARAALDMSSDLAASLEAFRAAFVVAAGDKSPFVKSALNICDTALDKYNESLKEQSK